MTLMRVCDACRKPVDDNAAYVEVVIPDGQRHFHDNGVCWTTVRTAIQQAIQQVRAG